MPARKPCSACPYRRKSLAGWLGADTPEGFMGTTMADVRMPCHKSVDYEGEDWEEQAAAAPECAGAATFFANICKRPRDPTRLVLAPDRKNVFTRPDEFIEHHRRGEE